MSKNETNHKEEERTHLTEDKGNNVQDNTRRDTQSDPADVNEAKEEQSDPNTQQHSDGVHETHPNAYRQEAAEKIQKVKKELDDLGELLSHL